MSPSLYRKILSFFLPKISERSQCVLEAKASTSSCCFRSTQCLDSLSYRRVASRS